MAFTAEEESVLKQVATAFHNAKRLQDLPEVSGGSNPFDLVTEVLDTDGESKQASSPCGVPPLCRGNVRLRCSARHHNISDHTTSYRQQRFAPLPACSEPYVWLPVERRRLGKQVSKPCRMAVGTA